MKEPKHLEEYISFRRVMLKPGTFRHLDGAGFLLRRHSGIGGRKLRVQHGCLIARGSLWKFVFQCVRLVAI
jgi:hypothetical protein